MIIKIAIWYLRLRKKSVIIGYKLRKETIQSFSRVSYLYDNDINLDEVTYLDSEGEVFVIPEGKFDTTSKNKNVINHFIIGLFIGFAIVGAAVAFLLTI